MIAYFFSTLLGVLIMFGPPALYVWWKERHQ